RGQGMGMRGHLTERQRVRLLPAGLTHVEWRQSRALPLTDRHDALKVWHREIGRPIAAVVRPQERKQCRVLGDGQDLTVALHPSDWCEVEAEKSQFSDKG